MTGLGMEDCLDLLTLVLIVPPSEDEVGMSSLYNSISASAAIALMDSSAERERVIPGREEKEVMCAGGVEIEDVSSR